MQSHPQRFLNKVLEAVKHLLSHFFKFLVLSLQLILFIFQIDVLLTITFLNFIPSK